MLLFIQLLRKVSHLRPLKGINTLAPLYDAYFHPLKDKHHYWFGVLLIVQGALLVVLTTTSTLSPELNVFILSMTVAALFFLISINNVYKHVHTRILKNTNLMNLLILSGGTVYKWESQTSRTTLLKVSICLSFAQFCAIALYSLIKPCYSAACHWYRQRQDYEIIDENSGYIIDERIEDPEPESLIVIARSRGTTDTATY